MTEPRVIPKRLSSCKIGELLVEHEMDILHLKEEIKRLVEEVKSLKGVKDGHS
jgi:hypothetical protein